MNIRSTQRDAALMLLCALSCILVTPAQSQTPTATTPGKTHPDFSGVWRHDFRFPGDKQFYLKHPEDLSFMYPWVRNDLERRRVSEAAGRQIPTTGLLCQLLGVPTIVMEAHDLQIIQTAEQIIFLGETDHQIRYVHMNQPHPVNVQPSWFGHSSGKWEGDTLVIDTIGLNEKTQMDPWGTPHSEAMHVIEKMRLIKNGSQFESTITIEDPLALKQPWTFTWHSEKARDAEFIGEYACAENNQDSNADLAGASIK